MSRNEITGRYLAEVAARGLGAHELAGLALAADVLGPTSMEGKCLSRPVFLDRAELAELTGDLATVYAALAALPRRLFGGDLTAFARAVGMADVQVGAVQRAARATPTRLARPDMYHDGTAFRLLEFNMGSTVGSLDSGLLNRLFLRHPVLAEFVESNNLTCVDPMAKMVDTLLAECGLDGADGVRFAAVTLPWVFPLLTAQLASSAGLLGELGVDITPCHLGQLSVRDGRVWLDAAPVDVLYRIFQVEDLLDPAMHELADPILRAADRGEVTLFTPMDAELYGSKGALAMLSDEANRHLYTGAELASLDRVLPWTRMVRSGPVTVGAEPVELLDYAEQARRELVLKPTLLHGGQGIVAGWVVDAETWRTAVKSALDGPYVLQHRVRPEPELFPAEHGLEARVVKWAPFHGLEPYAGMNARGSTDIRGGIVNRERDAITAPCFHEAG
jgi:hypothetical protein